MKNSVSKKTVLLFVAACLCGLAFSSCNTLRGVGRDVKRVGGAVERAAS